MVVHLIDQPTQCDQLAGALLGRASGRDGGGLGTRNGSRAFCFAQMKAAGDASTATTLACETSVASEIAIAPLPVPRSLSVYPISSTEMSFIIASKNANAGFFNKRQLVFGLFDQRIHGIPDPAWEDGKPPLAEEMAKLVTPT